MHPAPNPSDRSSRRWLSLSEAADYTGLSTKTIRRRVTDGSVAAFRAGPRELRFRMDDLDALMRPVPTAGTVGGAA
jgi:excisionase family DNA binding protein